MESFFRTHKNFVEHVKAPVRRTLMDEISWDDRLIDIRGARGVGKTTFLLQYTQENFESTDRRRLYINMNNFYFQDCGIDDFTKQFVGQGGKMLLIDQVFKQPNWSKELKRCHDRFPELRVIFTGSSMMRLKEENPELNGVVKSYNLHGFLFREFLNLKTNNQFTPYTLDEILTNHEYIIKQILPKASPAKYFMGYIHHGFYSLFLENRNFSENLLKTMNMMTEVDILPIEQIELKYLTKIKKLFHLLATEEQCAPNINNLAYEIHTSRATVMNYIKYLADARLINIIYLMGQDFPRKPNKVMMHNTNLQYVIYPSKVDIQDLMGTFFVNCMWKNHAVNQAGKNRFYLVDGRQKFRICDAESEHKVHYSSGTVYARYNAEVGQDDRIPLWLFGFLY